MNITVQELIDKLNQYPYDKGDPVWAIEEYEDLLEIESVGWDDSGDRFYIELKEFHRDNEEEEPTPEPTFNEHQTYNIMFAIAAFKEGLEVYVDGTLSNESDRRLYTVSAIADCDDHLFIIKKGDQA
jgi:hypothetical protein